MEILFFKWRLMLLFWSPFRNSSDEIGCEYQSNSERNFFGPRPALGREKFHSEVGSFLGGKEIVVGGLILDDFVDLK